MYKITSPACEKAPNEDSYHLLFVCPALGPAYAVPRQALTLSLKIILLADTLNNKKQFEHIFCTVQTI